MKKVFYIAHSGFAIETDQSVLLFDYVEGVLPKLSKSKPWYVFVSHAHGDHYSQKIFTLKKKEEQIMFLLSSDIAEDRVEDEWKNHCIFIKPWEKIMVDGMWIETLKSTDEGVAFLVTLPDSKTIYHAGDLNDWFWEEEKPEWNRKMEETYDLILEKIKGRHVQIAFVPVDPRLGKHAYDGAEHFLAKVETDRLVPMHCWEDYSVIEGLERKVQQMGLECEIVKITGLGQEFCVEE